MNAQFQPGEPVFHATFGSGAILSSEMRGETEYVRVHFEAGTKSLAAQYLARKEEDAGRARNQAHAAVRPVPSQPQKAIRKRTIEPLRPFNAADFAREEMPSRRFLDERSLIPWEGVTLLFGDGATGKSLLLLQLMCGVARTTKWMGRRVDTGRAVYFSAEDTKAETHIRLGSIARHEGFTFDHLPDLDIHFMAGKDCVLGAVDRRTGIVQATELFEQLRTDCLRRRPTLIGIDNLIDVFAGDVINPAQAKQFMHLLTGLSIECGCPVVLLAHPSKSGMSGGDGDGGTRAWSNSARARLYLQRVLTGGNHGEAPVEDDPDLRVLSTKKANYGPAGTEIRLKWEDGRFVSMDDPPPGVRDVFGQALKAERVFLHLLRWHLEKGKTVSPNKSNAYAPTVFARHPKAEGIKARQFENVMNMLLDQNRIEIFTHGSPSSRRQHLGLPIGREEPEE